MGPLTPKARGKRAATLTKSRLWAVSDSWPSRYRRNPAWGQCSRTEWTDRVLPDKPRVSVCRTSASECVAESASACATECTEQIAFTCGGREPRRTIAGCNSMRRSRSPAARTKSRMYHCDCARRMDSDARVNQNVSAPGVPTEARKKSPRKRDQHPSTEGPGLSRLCVLFASHFHEISAL